MNKKARCAASRSNAWVVLLVLSTLGLFLGGHAPVDASDWPTYRHDNSRTGATDDTLQLPLRSRWVYHTPAAPRMAWSSAEGRLIERNLIKHRTDFDAVIDVAIVGDRVYFGSSVDHQLHCLDANSGKTEWTFPTGGPIRLCPTVVNGRVYFGSDDGYAYCLDANEGRLVWKLKAAPAEEWILARGEMISRWPIRTGILVDGGTAYCGAGIFPHENVYMLAATADEGKRLWYADNFSQKDASREDFSPQGYLLASDDLLFAPSGRSLPAAIDRQTGKMVYHAKTGRLDGGGLVGGTRALLADGQLYAAGQHHMVALDQKNAETGFGWFDGTQVIVHGDAAYVANGTNIAKLNRQMYAEASRERHKLEIAADLLPRLIEGKGHKQEAQVKRAVSQMMAQNKIELPDGRPPEEALQEVHARLKQLTQVGIEWQVSSKEDAALMVAGDCLVSGGDGIVTAYSTADGKELWKSAVDGKAQGLAAADGNLYVSTTAGRIYCFGEQPQGTNDAVMAETGSNPYPADQWTEVYAAAADDILKQTGVDRGFCLVVGNEEGRLAYELAKRSQLKIYAIEPDAEKVAAARKALSAAGLYGHRITVLQREFDDIPYSNYFANLVVSDTLLRTGMMPGNPPDIARHVKPVGGTVCLGAPKSAQNRAPAGDLEQWLKAMQLGSEGSIRTSAGWVILTRGELPGAGNWSHQYGDPGNTASSGDQRVTGGLSVLWYGDPGPDKVQNRHDGAVGPLAVNGRLFVQGETSVMAYDAYNGQFLWEHEDAGAVRAGVFQNWNPGNLVASDDSILIMIGDQCIERDAATGEIRTIHRLPAAKDNGTFEWGYVACQDGILFGTATVRKSLDAHLRRRGMTTKDSTDSIFAIDLETGRHLWSHDGQSISANTIAIGPGRVCFIDSSITADERAEILRQDKSEFEKLTGEAANLAEQRMKNIDVRKAVALDAKSGQELWSALVDVTDCSDVGTGGGKLTMMFHNNTLLLCGANANGHFWKQFVAGEFERRRLVALSAEDGYKLWAKDANYRHRPIIVGNRVIAEPWAFELDTGEQIMHSNPVTGESVPWSIMRTGHHCGMLTGCDNMLVFRTGSTGFYDLKADTGVSHFAGHRLGCWINAIPANGLVMIPEASAGCVCLFSIASTIVMEPKQEQQPWTVYSSVGSTTPVKQMALNLGAPGDRRDANGTMWLAYPRPKPYQSTALDLAVALDPKFAKGGGYESLNDETAGISGSVEPWVLASWARGLTRATVPLLGKDDAPATYTVKLYFAELDEQAKPGDRTFDVKLQGNTVLKDYDPLSSTGGSRRSDVRVFKNVAVTDSLQVELLPHNDNPSPPQLPVLNAIEVVREN